MRLDTEPILFIFFCFIYYTGSLSPSKVTDYQVRKHVVKP